MKSVFPMPLAPFEHMMLADDCPDHPKSFFIQMKFQGRFDDAQLNVALEKALTLHPLLNSRIHGSAKDATSRITWIEAESPAPTIDWNHDDIPIQFAAGPQIDLNSETGLRVWLRETDAATTLMLQIHHCCCDGIGASCFIDSLLTAYHLIHTSASTSVLEKMYDSKLLPDRDPSCCTWHRVLKTAWHAISRISQYYKHSPVPLATPRVLPLDDSGVSPFPQFRTHTFDEEDTERIELTAKRLGVSLNVLLMRDLFLSLDRWNQQYSPEHCSRTIRVCIPINLRRPIHHRMPAANMVSLLFLDAVADQLHDPGRLLLNLQAQLEQTLRLRKFLVFVPALRLLGMFRGGLVARMKKTKCMASSVLTNLGVLGSRSPLTGLDGRMVSGGVILESVEVVLPLRPLTHAVFAALKYCGKLSVTLSYDPRWIDDTDGFELLENYGRQLMVSVTEATSAQLVEATSVSNDA